MQILKGKQRGKSIEIQEIPISAMTLLPPPPDVCQECARDHAPGLPHDKQSLYYQTKFQMEHGRGATWADAMAHCSDEVKAIWTEELQKLGVEVE
ncbi:hypothetical protein [Sporomusa sphaeroides]|uniref:hypothetical protein n=1 Tax=Sporomusa sphaeroides TaxID=47679 RepID=UPI00202FBDA9|nr:hypothetical protein [Sporomusa sphaeroides]MCM0757416.1 hypothetical protein [Sporomusa sphaeroides DSM 2875]HML33810.1 hypothetical protein [Sporomusa sphaeroides]